jgi:hypothetical protein
MNLTFIITNLVYNQCTKLMPMMTNWQSQEDVYELIRVLWDVKAEGEMNQCCGEVSNMTMTDETLEIKYVLDLCCKVDRVI